MNPPVSMDLETIIGRELRQLPTPSAPHTLLPRVLAAVHAWRMRPWYERTWFTWPVEWQMASAAALILLVAGGGMMMPGARAAAVAATSTFAAPLMGEIADAARSTAVAVNAAAVLWRALVEPFVPYAFGLVALMCLACALFATALNHVAFGSIAFGRIVQR
jgi:hypothetical protein